MTTEEVRQLYAELERLQRVSQGRFPVTIKLVESFLRYGEAEGVLEGSDALHDCLPVGDGAVHCTGARQDGH